jgi:uncharacterized membrane protein YedE/YeeE
MVKNAYALLFGLLFGIGLIVGQMSNPDKVLAFLDVAGAWDPSLALVMVAALLVLGGSQYLLRNRSFAPKEQLQPSCDSVKPGIDRQLIVGASIFGAGWGLSGICPGPAIVGLGTGIAGFYIYAGAMFAGFILFNFLHRKG